MHEPSISNEDYVLGYQLNAERLRCARPNALVLHPGPLNRGIEITPEVADSPQSCVLEQVTNGIAVRMALLFLLAAGGSEDDGQQATEASPPRNRRSTDHKDATDRKDVKDSSHASH